MPPARLLALSLCWGASVPAMKVMVETIPPLGGAAAVFLAGGVVLAALAGGLRGAGRAQLRWAAVTGAVLLGAQGMATVALTELSASLTAILTASNALWAAAFARFAGVPMDGSVPAVAAALGSSALWGLGTVLAAHGGALPRDPLVTGAAQLLAGGALLLAIAAGARPAAP